MSGNPQRRFQEPPALLLAEEAIQLIKRAGPPAVAVYLIGTLPFLLGLTFYWAAMASSAHAHAYASAGALGLALLFLWMKAFQARFAQHLRALLLDRAMPPWRASSFLATFCRQGALHATVVLLYPVCFLTLLPMGFAAAWYQNVTVLDDGASGGMRALMREAAMQAFLWPRQNHILLWLASPLMIIVGAAIFLGTYPVLDGLQYPGGAESLIFSMGYLYAGVVLLAILPLAPFACFVTLNVATGLFFTIEMFHVLTGADTLYTRNAGALVQNSTFIALTCSLTYVLLDPILKASYTIRCHHGAARRSGVDLRVALARIKDQSTRAAVSLLVLACLSSALLPALAEAQPLDADRVTALDRAVDEELSAQRYSWRMPREPRADVEMPWLLQAFHDLGISIRDGIARVFRFILDVWDWITDWINGRDGSGGGGWDVGGFNPSLRLLVIFLAIVLTALTVYLLWRSYRMNPPQLLDTEVSAPAETPDIESESTTAADLPEDEWFSLARDLAARGEYRLAARALFFSILATLAQQEILRIARFKSNMDYGQEVSRRAASLGDTPEIFFRSALLYEAVWYGEHDATEETLNQLQACQERLRHADH